MGNKKEMVVVILVKEAFCNRVANLLSIFNGIYEKCMLLGVCYFL